MGGTHLQLPYMGVGSQLRISRLCVRIAPGVPLNPKVVSLTLIELPFPKGWVIDSPSSHLEQENIENDEATVRPFTSNSLISIKIDCVPLTT